MNIILVGYMGSGKTTVGKNLARILNAEFIDTDEQIEKQQGRSISEIFAMEGELAFRDIETEYLKAYLKNFVQKDKNANVIISTGGGMALREENQKLLKKIGTVFYLKVNPETVYERIKGDTKRPLLQCENPLERIRQMLSEREVYYQNTANEIIQVDDKKQSEIAQIICKKVGAEYEDFSN